MITQERLIQATIESARLQGCICNPRIDIGGSDGFYSGVVAHDKWCPLSPYYAAKQSQSSASASEAGESDD
jgi:hypothetical protein